MKGIVFTEFLEMVETRYSLTMVDHLIQVAVPGGGIYTAVGSYDYRELLGLIEELARCTGTAKPELIRAFGRYLFQRFALLYPHFLDGVDDVFEFLSGVETHVHTEVRKLYPQAELPTFTWEDLDANSAVMIYRSSRPFGDLAEGLLEGCGGHFGEEIRIDRTDVEIEAGTMVRFHLTRG